MEPANTTDLLYSIRRTVVPIVAGFLLSQAARVGFDIPQDDLVGVLESLVTGAYYIVVRLAEERLPALGLLLGATRRPTYN